MASTMSLDNPRRSPRVFKEAQTHKKSNEAEQRSGELPKILQQDPRQFSRVACQIPFCSSQYRTWNLHSRASFIQEVEQILQKSRNRGSLRSADLVILWCPRKWGLDSHGAQKRVQARSTLRTSAVYQSTLRVQTPQSGRSALTTSSHTQHCVLYKGEISLPILLLVQSNNTSRVKQEISVLD